MGPSLRDFRSKLKLFRAFEYDGSFALPATRKIFASSRPSRDVPSAVSCGVQSLLWH